MNEGAYREAEATYWRACGTSPTERWLELGGPATGRRVRVLEVGAGPPLLFVHGGPNAATAWAPLAALLPEHRCILLDRPGCGLSPRAAYGETKALRPLVVAVLSSTIEALGLERVDVVASSFGGTCALWLGLDRPERVGRVVQMGCPAFVPDMVPGPFLRLLATPVLGAIVARAPMGPAAVAGSFKGMGHDALVARGMPAPLVAWYAALAGTTDTMKNERELVRTAMSPFGARAGVSFAREEILRVAQPTCFYWGGRDPFWPRGEAERLAADMSATIEVDEQGGHLPWLDDPARAASTVRRHLAVGTVRAA